jgi:hypothetical protein
MARAYVDIPESWTRVATRHVGPFVTGETFQSPDGETIEWNSRANRKRGHAIGWWIAVLFMIGSACLAIGPLPFYAEAVGDWTDAVTFFVGSIFFTTAAFLQLVECGRAPRSLTKHHEHRARLLIALEARRIDWWACAIQFLGTLFFNVTTFNTINANYSAAESNAQIWLPDWRGSICFLVSSWLAYLEAGHRLWSWEPQSRSWRIAALNLLGSIFFGISAVASYVLASTDEVWNLRLTNLGTIGGAICFFWGAALLLPESKQHAEAAAPS